jgi:hypothetical protein
MMDPQDEVLDSPTGWVAQAPVKRSSNAVEGGIHVGREHRDQEQHEADAREPPGPRDE